MVAWVPAITHLSLMGTVLAAHHRRNVGGGAIFDKGLYCSNGNALVSNHKRFTPFDLMQCSFSLDVFSRCSHLLHPELASAIVAKSLGTL